MVDKGFPSSESADKPRDHEDAGPAALPMPAPRSVFLGGLFIIALLAVCYVASDIILPIVLALVLKLVLWPVMRVLMKLHIPRTIAAVLIIVLLFGSFFALGSALSEPAAGWTKQFVAGVPKLQHRLSFLTTPVTTMQAFLHHADGLTETGAKPLTVTVEGSRLSDRLLTDTRTFLSGIFQTILVLFFLLIAGDTFLRRIVESLPRFHDKRQAVQISQQIESDISAYLVTITIMNATVGIATAIVMWLTGVGDPILWGTVAFLLNYAPIVGPASGVLIFLLAGLLTIDTFWQAFLPAGLYLAIHLVEGEAVTPLLLARRFTLNPVLVILSLVFWFWMWGIPGAILSVPMLAIAKIVCDRIRPLAAIGHFLAG